MAQDNNTQTIGLSPNVITSQQIEISEQLPYIKLSLFSNTTLWQLVKNEFETIAGSLPSGETDDRKRERGNLLIGDIAIATGFTISAGNIVFNPSSVDIAKFTYLMAFYLPFKSILVDVNGQKKSQTNDGLWNSWWKSANRIRLQYWQDNQGGTVYKRLCPNGEEEVWTINSIPQDEIIPAIASNDNKSKERYDYFDIVMHKTLEQTFFTNGVSEVSIPYYYLANIEAPFYTNGWVRFSRYLPYNVTSNYGIPYPESGYTKINISNIKMLNGSNQLIETDFFHSTLGTVSNYGQFPVVDSLVLGNSILVINGKLKINAFKSKKVYVSINSSTHSKLSLSVKSNGDFYAGNQLVKEVSGTNKYNPDIFSSVNFLNNYAYWDNSLQKFYVNELESVVLYADYTLSGTVVVGDLYGLRIYKEGTTYDIRVAGASVVGNYPNSGQKYIIGQSGITIGIGIDIGNSFTATTDIQKKTYFEDTILANNAPNWSNIDKSIIRGAYGLKKSIAENYWLKNIATFNQLNLQINNSSYYNVLIDTAGFAKQFYYHYAISALKAKGLKTELNIAEEYAVLTLMYNAPTSFKAHASKFVEAINQHDHPLLLSAVNSVNSFSKKGVTTKLNSTDFKTYYNEFQFNNLTI